MCEINLLNLFHEFIIFSCLIATNEVTMTSEVTVKEYLSTIINVSYRMTLDMSSLGEVEECNIPVRSKVKKCTNMRPTFQTLHDRAKEVYRNISSESEISQKWYTNIFSNQWQPINAYNPDKIIASLLSLQDGAIILSETMKKLMDITMGEVVQYSPGCHFPDVDWYGYKGSQTALPYLPLSFSNFYSSKVRTAFYKCINLQRAISLLSYRVDSAIKARQDQLQQEEENNKAFRCMMNDLCTMY